MTKEDCFSFIKLEVDTGDLETLCALGAAGWDIATSKPTEHGFELILKKGLFGDEAIDTVRRFIKKQKEMLCET